MVRFFFFFFAQFSHAMHTEICNYKIIVQHTSDSYGLGNVNFAHYLLYFVSNPGREQNQLQLQRAKDLKLQMIQQQIRKREKLAEFQYTAPEMNQQSLPATVLPEMNSGRSLIKDRLREKLLPYKKLPKQEAPKTPQTPVEEMQMLQIRLGTSRKISVDKRGGM